MNALRLFTMMSMVLLAAVSLNAAADTTAFKCTAEDGKVSYLDTRPATGCATIEVVRVNVGKGTTGEAQEQADAANASEAKDAKDVAEKKAQIKKDCDARRASLQTLKTKPVVKVKDEDGKEKVLSPEEMVKTAKEIQTYIDNFCTN